MLAVQVYGCAPRPELDTLATQIAHALIAMPKNAKDALAEGLVDAVGFVGGALAGWQVGRLFGFDVLAPGPFDSRAMIGWAFLLAGCGLGKWASLRWRARRLKSKE